MNTYMETIYEWKTIIGWDICVPVGKPKFVPARLNYVFVVSSLSRTSKIIGAYFHNEEHWKCYRELRK
jgi:hypothetical protein